MTNPLPDPDTLQVIVRAGIRQLTVNFPYEGELLKSVHRAALHEAVDDATDAINREIKRSSKHDSRRA